MILQAKNSLISKVTAPLNWLACAYIKANYPDMYNRILEEDKKAREAAEAAHLAAKAAIEAALKEEKERAEQRAKLDALKKASERLVAAKVALDEATREEASADNAYVIARMAAFPNEDNLPLASQ